MRPFEGQRRDRRLRRYWFVVLALTFVLLLGSPGLAAADALERMRAVLTSARAGLPTMKSPAEEAAVRLRDGGRLFAAGQPSMISELSGRAGGFIMLQSWRDQPLEENDVVLYFAEPSTPTPEALRTTPALVLGFGASDVDGAAITFRNHSTEHGVSPTLANAVPAWVFCGELFAACTRLGKTPAMFESIGMYSAHARNAALQQAATFFHDAISIPPVAYGDLGGAYLTALAAMLNRVEVEEMPAIGRTARWAADAVRSGKGIYMFSMGHLFPDEIEKTEIGTRFVSQVYNAGFRSQPLPTMTFEPGDVLVHIGYQHAPSDLLHKARSEGARVCYVSLYAAREFDDDIDVLWIDPMWRWPDACVVVDGYDVPILAASGVMNGAIAWEIYAETVRLLGNPS